MFVLSKESTWLLLVTCLQKWKNLSKSKLFVFSMLFCVKVTHPCVKRAQKAGILIMNEVGLDPGMDHMSAMKIIDEAKANGTKVSKL